MLAATKQSAQTDGMKILADERYARTDTSAEAQALKLMSVHPQAIMMGNSATPAALPVVALRHRGYQGRYLRQPRHRQSRLHQGRRRRRSTGVIADTSPLVVYNQLPDNNVIKPVAAAFMADVRQEVRPAEREPVRRLQL